MEWVKGHYERPENHIKYSLNKIAHKLAVDFLKCPHPILSLFLTTSNTPSSAFTMWDCDTDVHAFVDTPEFYERTIRTIGAAQPIDDAFGY